MEQKLSMKDKKEDMIKAYENLLAKHKEKERDKGTDKEAEVKKSS